MPTLTADMIKSGCSDQVVEFKWRFPDGVTIETREEAIAEASAVADVFDWDWATRNLLSTPARKAYMAATSQAREDYLSATAPAWEAYMADKAPAWEAYKTATAPAWEAYKTALATAFAAAWFDDNKLADA